MALKTIRLNSENPADLKKAIHWLQEGKIGALPTETVYGLAGDATRSTVAERIFQAKDRPAEDPLIVHVASPDFAKLFGIFPEAAFRLGQSFWPGPLTLIVPKTHRIPSPVTAGGSTVALRNPSHAVMHQILKDGKLALAAPSANSFGKLSPTRADHVLSQLDGKIDFILDDGPTGWGVESTVLDVSQPNHWKLYRPGPVDLEELRVWVQGEGYDLKIEDCSRESAREQESHPLPSPGILAKHYAPHTALKLIHSAEVKDREKGIHAGKRWGLIKTGLSPDVASNDVHPQIKYCSEDGTLESAGKNLYAHLHTLDRAGYDMLYVEIFPHSGLGAALNNRLFRAASEKDSNY